MKLPFIFLSLFLYANIYAQRLEHTSLLTPSTTKNLRIDYENDFFVGLDQYYSQGMGFNFNHPKLSFNPCNFIFPKIKNSSSTYGLYLSQEVYTPINIGSEIIQLNDRPFAAKLSLDSY